MDARVVTAFFDGGGERYFGPCNFVAAVHHKSTASAVAYTRYIGAASKKEANSIMRQIAEDGDLGTVYKTEFVSTAESLGYGSEERIKVGDLDKQISWLHDFCEAWDEASEYMREWLCEIYNRFCWDHDTPNISADEAVYELMCKREREKKR